MTSLPSDDADSERARFEREGFVAVAGFLSPEQVAQAGRWADELEALPETPGRTMKYFDPSPTGEGRLLNRIENFVPYHAGLGALVCGEPLLGFVSRLLGEPAGLFKDKINLKLPGGAGFEPHQDAQAGWNDYGQTFVTAAIAIDRTTAENGCLELARWKHRRELIGPLWEPLGPAQLSSLEFQPFPMEPGDALFFDAYLPHRSGPNPTAQSRRVLYVTYNPASDGDQRARYYADKRRSYPPDCEREPGRRYEYKV